MTAFSKQNYFCYLDKIPLIHTSDLTFNIKVKMKIIIYDIPVSQLVYKFRQFVYVVLQFRIILWENNFTPILNAQSKFDSENITGNFNEHAANHYKQNKM